MVSGDLKRKAEARFEVELEAKRKGKAPTCTILENTHCCSDEIRIMHFGEGECAYYVFY